MPEERKCEVQEHPVKRHRVFFGSRPLKQAQISDLDIVVEVELMGVRTTDNLFDFIFHLVVNPVFDNVFGKHITF